MSFVIDGTLSAMFCVAVFFQTAACNLPDVGHVNEFVHYGIHCESGDRVDA